MVPTSMIRILWTSNVVLPAVAKELGLSQTPFCGWLQSMLDRLVSTRSFIFGVAMRANVKSLRWVERDGVFYVAMPTRRFDQCDISQKDCQSVLSDFKPDILHLQGAEMRFARRFLSTSSAPSVLSIQGILAGIAPYELGRLPMWQMFNPRHPKLMLTGAALVANNELRFRPRLRHERAAMAMANHVVGRTHWDHAYAAYLSPQASYHLCGEILRSAFYSRRWSLDCAERYSIFVGNGAIPRKGVHLAVRALAFLRTIYPGAKLYIAGEDLLQLPMKSLKRHIGYPVYLINLIERLNLKNHVHFTGYLEEENMAQCMSRCHVYVMSSLIENSPNTLGEAMLMGVPVVSAYAGGSPSLAQDEQEALFYRADDPIMMAYQVGRIFADDTLAVRLSEQARNRALVNHDPERNVAALATLYERVYAEGRTTHE